MTSGLWVSTRWLHRKSERRERRVRYLIAMILSKSTKRNQKGDAHRKADQTLEKPIALDSDAFQGKLQLSDAGAFVMIEAIGCHHQPNKEEHKAKPAKDGQKQIEVHFESLKWL